jgi:hypothetical protein
LNFLTLTALRKHVPLRKIAIAMIVTINKSDTVEKLNQLLAKLQKGSSEKGVDTRRYCGIIKLKEDTLLIQKKLRDEWE